MPFDSTPETSATPARIAIGGDQGLMRAAVRGLVERDPGLTVVFECESRADALAEALHETPGLFLVDLDLDTRCNVALERVGALLDVTAGTPMLFLTGSAESRAVQFALERGAAGFVMKDRAPEVLYRAIRAALAGETWIERSTMTSVLRASTAAAEKEHVSGADQLTAREREIIGLVAEGLHNKAIAQRLHISDTTVRHHLTSVFDKLGVANRLELMTYVFNAATSLIPTRHTCVGAMAESGCEVARKMVASTDADARPSPYLVVSRSAKF